MARIEGPYGHRFEDLRSPHARTAFDPDVWVRPRVARGMTVRLALLRSCINVLGLKGWSIFHLLPATMDMCAHSISLAEMSLLDKGVTRFRMRREDRCSMPCSCLSQTSAGKLQR